MTAVRLNTHTAAEDDEVLVAAARAMSVRNRLDSLLLEALASPGMATGPVQQIADLFSSGALRAAEESLTVLRERSR